MKKVFYSVAAAGFWIILWEIIYLAVGQSILVPSPLSVFNKLCEFVVLKDFWISVATSLLRVVSGLFFGTVLGTVLAVLTAKSKLLRFFFWWKDGGRTTFLGGALGCRWTGTFGSL